jgi:hypothetical protein
MDGSGIEKPEDLYTLHANVGRTGSSVRAVQRPYIDLALVESGPWKSADLQTFPQAVLAFSQPSTRRVSAVYYAQNPSEVARILDFVGHFPVSAHRFFMVNEIYRRSSCWVSASFGRCATRHSTKLAAR